MHQRTAGRSRRPSVVLAGTAAALALVLAGPPAVPASAAPGDRPGATTGVLGGDALDRLQRRAAEVRADLLGRRGEAVAAQEALARAGDEAAGAEAAVAEVEGELAGSRAAVAAYASAVYREGGAPTPLRLLLTGGDPGEVVAVMGFLDAVDAHAAEVVGAAERRRRAVVAGRDRAAAALADAQAHADRVAAEVDRLAASAAAVTGELEAALGDVDRELAHLQPEQVRVDEETAANWRAHLDELVAAGVTPPAAAQLLDPAAGLPGGLVPVGAVGGGAQAGVAQLPRRPTPLLVLPRETLTAVTTAMDLLGRPYAPGAVGPGSYDCGSLVRAVYRAAGIELPGDQAGLFAATRPIAPADVLPGDLVFLGTPESGPGHVGLALDSRSMLAADARAGAVVVRSLPTDQVLLVGRPSTGPWPAVRVPGPVGGAPQAECGDTVGPPATTATGRGAATPTG
ncbi:C40 family peptidase [Blastococcus sp. SYSU D00695]